MKNRQTKIDIAKQKFELFINIFRRFWLIVIIATIIGGIIGGVLARITYTPEYTVTQAFTINLENHPEINSNGITDSQLSKTIPSLLSSETFAQKIYPFLKEANADGKFKVTSLSSTNIFYLTVDSRSNKKCLKMIEIIKEHYSDIATSVIGYSEMDYFTEPSTSPLPSNTPKFTARIVVGAILALLIVIAIIAFRAIFTKVISTSSEVEEITKSKCLATFNTSKIKRRSSDSKQKYKMPLINSDSCDLDILQSTAMLSTNVENACKKNGYKSILTTSTISGEGKSSISINLALSLANKGNKVIIVDADLRTPSIANYLGVEKLDGLLSSAIDNRQNLNSTTTQIDDNLYLLANSEHTDSAFEETTSIAFSEIIKQLENDYDYIIIDAAPVGILGDAVSIAESVDAFIYVISQNYINQGNMIRGLSIMDNANARLIGCVLNYKS